MVDEIVHTSPRQKHDFVLKFPDATKLGFIVTDELGNPEPTRISEQQIDRTALKTTSGQTKYSDFEWPYMSIVQDDWSGGRGAKNFEDDTSRFYDSWGVRTDISGKVVLGGRGNYTTGFRNMDQIVPTFYFLWQALTGARRGVGTPFTASATYSTSTVEVWLRKVGTPATLTVKLRADATGLPGAALNANATATITAASVTDTLSFLHSFTWTAAQNLTSGTDYWVTVEAGATDDSSNYWELGYSTLDVGANSADIITWEFDVVTPCVRVLDASYAFRPIFFEYKRGLYMVRTDREDTGTNAILYINGDRGTADANTGALDTLVDATKTWTTDEFSGSEVIIIAGPGSEEPQPWRRCIGNDATTLEVSPNWNIEHTTSTEYVIVEADKWRLVGLDIDAGGPLPAGDLGGPVTDVAVAGDFVYFARGETNSLTVLRYEAYNNAGTWTERGEAEDFSALYLQAIRHPDEGMVIYGACNVKTDGTYGFGTRRVWKANVPRAWGKLYRSLGTIDATNTPWDSRVITNVVQNTNGKSSYVTIGAGFGTGIVMVRDLDTPMDLRQGKYIGLYLSSTVTTADANDVQFVLSDAENLGLATLPSYVYHYDGATTYVDTWLAADGSAASPGILTSLDTDEYLYICGASKFDTINFDIGTTPNAQNATMTVEYFNGSAWAAVTTLVDTTITGVAPNEKTLAQDGSMTITVPWNWAQFTVNSKTGYWVRMKPSANLTASVTINEITISRATVVELDTVAMTAGVEYWVRIAISPTAISTIDYSSIKSIGIKLTSDLGAQQIYIEDVQLLNELNSWVSIPYDHRITGLHPYAGNQVDPYTNPWVFTDKGVFEIQTQNGDTLVELPIGEIKELASEQSGRARTVNDVYLYFTLGNEKVERYYGRNLDDIGPDLDEGLPGSRRGKVSAMLSYPGRVFLAIDAGNSGYSSILAYKGSGWHEVWRAEQSGQHILGLFHQVIPGSMIGRLWCNAGNEIVWIPFTLNDNIPDTDTQGIFRYFHEGTLETPWIYGNMVDVIKQWNNMKLFLEDTSTTEYIKADYKVDTDTGWTAIAGDYNTEPSEELKFSTSDPPNLSARKIKIRLRFQGGGDASPSLTALLIEAYGVTPVKYRYVFPCMLSEMDDQRVDLDENEEAILGAYSAVETAIAKLRTAVDNGYALTLTSRFSPYTSKTVILSSAIGRPVQISDLDSNTVVEKHLFQIALDQL